MRIVYWSHEISYLIYFFHKLGKMLQNLSSAAVVIKVLRINFEKISADNNKSVKNYPACEEWKLLSADVL